MAKSLRSKRMRRNRALQAEKKAPRVLKRLKDNLAEAKKFNVRYCDAYSSSPTVGEFKTAILYLFETRGTLF